MKLEKKKKAYRHFIIIIITSLDSFLLDDINNN